MAKQVYILFDAGQFGAQLKALIQQCGEEDPDIDCYLEYLVEELTIRAQRIHPPNYYYAVYLDMIEPVQQHGIIKCLIELEPYGFDRGQLVALLNGIVDEMANYIESHLLANFWTGNITRIRRNSYCLGVLIHDVDRRVGCQPISFAAMG